ncbi:unnamed protein product [Arctogadus glacialis]
MMQEKRKTRLWLTHHSGRLICQGPLAERTNTLFIQDAYASSTARRTSRNSTVGSANVGGSDWPRSSTDSLAFYGTEAAQT